MSTLQFSYLRRVTRRGCVVLYKLVMFLFCIHDYGGTAYDWEVMMVSEAMARSYIDVQCFEFDAKPNTM
jgi:hypothetical protein